MKASLTHNEDALCRYWKHVLRAEEVVKADHPSLTPWLDLESEKCMFHEDQLDKWEIEHLWAYHWYIEMLVDRTPQHEEENRRSIEPSFRSSHLVHQQALRAPATTKQGAKRPWGKGKSTTLQANNTGKEAAARSSKRGLSPVSSETQKHSRVQDDQSAQQEPEEEALSISQNKSSKGISKSSVSFGASDSEIKRFLVNRGNVGKELNELVLNVSVSALLDNSDISENLSRFLTKIKLLPLISVKLFARFRAHVLVSITFVTVDEGRAHLSHRWIEVHDRNDRPANFRHARGSVCTWIIRDHTSVEFHG
jgi:hypothetical protein